VVVLTAVHDIFWSAYLGTWLAVFFDGFSPNGTFILMYSINGKITRSWSTYQNLYVTQACSGCGVSYNDASHAYPDVDTTGKVRVSSPMCCQRCSANDAC